MSHIFLSHIVKLRICLAILILSQIIPSHPLIIFVAFVWAPFHSLIPFWNWGVQNWMQYCSYGDRKATLAGLLPLCSMTWWVSISSPKCHWPFSANSCLVFYPLSLLALFQHYCCLGFSLFEYLDFRWLPLPFKTILIRFECNTSWENHSKAQL